MRSGQPRSRECCLNSPRPPPSQGTAYQDRFYEMRVTCGENYPVVPPTVRFVSRLNLPCVNSVSEDAKHFLSP
jgi:hypothetical protein